MNGWQEFFGGLQKRNNLSPANKHKKYLRVHMKTDEEEWFKAKEGIVGRVPEVVVEAERPKSKYDLFLEKLKATGETLEKSITTIQKPVTEIVSKFVRPLVSKPEDPLTLGEQVLKTGAGIPFELAKRPAKWLQAWVAGEERGKYWQSMVKNPIGSKESMEAAGKFLEKEKEMRAKGITPELIPIEMTIDLLYAANLFQGAYNAMWVKKNILYPNYLQLKLSPKEVTNSVLKFKQSFIKQGLSDADATAAAWQRFEGAFRKANIPFNWTWRGGLKTWIKKPTIKITPETTKEILKIGEPFKKATWKVSPKPFKPVTPKPRAVEPLLKKTAEEQFYGKTVTTGKDIEWIYGEPPKPAEIPKWWGIHTGGEVGRGGLPIQPPTQPMVTRTQLARGHILAQEKLLLSGRGKVKPQYRRLAKGMTGKTSMAKMTEPEAEDFINALKKIETRFVAGKKVPPRIPTTKRIAPAEFFKREFKKPSLLKFITPSDRYARSLGTYELIEPLIQSKMKMILESRKLYKWLDRADRQISKFEKPSLIEKGKEFITMKPTAAKRKWMQMLDTYKTGTEAGLTGEQGKLFNEMRGLTETMIARANEVREVVGLAPIKGIRAYVTHIKDIVGRRELREKYPFPEEIKYWLTRIQSKHIYNPTALHRLIQNMETTLQDPVRALKAMTAMDLKQIYLEYPNTIFREQMNALTRTPGVKYSEAELKKFIPSDTRIWTEAYVNEVIKGYPTKLDNLTNASLEKMGIPQAINWILKPFGRGLGANPSKQIAGTIGRLVHDATIWGRAKLVIRNHLQKFLTLGLYDTKAFVKAFLPANKELKWMMDNSDFLKISKSEFMEALPQGVFSKAERAGFLPYGHSHISNVHFTEKVAYHATKNLGWPMEDRMKEMEYAANTTQYWYNLMGMPELYRSGVTRALGTLQSWFQNYTMKYWRELLYRGFKGKTGWGKPIPFKWRIGALRHIVVSLLLVEGTRRGLGLDYKRTVLLGTLPEYLSPPGQITLGLYGLVTADNERARKAALNKIKYSYKAFIPGSMAWRDWWKAWDEKNLKGLLFYEEKKPYPKGFEEWKGGGKDKSLTPSQKHKAFLEGQE